MIALEAAYRLYHPFFLNSAFSLHKYCHELIRGAVQKMALVQAEGIEVVGSAPCGPAHVRGKGRHKGPAPTMLAAYLPRCT